VTVSALALSFLFNMVLFIYTCCWICKRDDDDDDDSDWTCESGKMAQNRGDSWKQLCILHSLWRNIFVKSARLAVNSYYAPHCQVQTMAKLLISNCF